MNVVAQFNPFQLDTYADKASNRNGYMDMRGYHTVIADMKKKCRNDMHVLISLKFQK